MMDNNMILRVGGYFLHVAYMYAIMYCGI